MIKFMRPFFVSNLVINVSNLVTKELKMNKFKKKLKIIYKKSTTY